MTRKQLAFLSALRAALSPEQLPPPIDDTARPRRTPFARMLFAIEPLPHDPVAPRPPRRRWLRLLFGIERLDSP